MKHLAATSHVEQDLRRLEATGKSGVQVLQSLYDYADAERVHVAERSTPERRKADAEDGAYITVSRRSDDPFTETPRGFVQHRQHGSLLNLNRGHFRVHRCVGRRWRDGLRDRNAS